MMTTLLEEKLTLPLRPRRNRVLPAIRDMVQETHLLPQHLVAPLFVIDGTNQREQIGSMPGVERLSIDLLLLEIETLQNLGIRAVDLFAYVPQELKNPHGTAAFEENNLISRAIGAVKKTFPDLCVMADVALDPYTDHGHDGAIDDSGIVINDLSVHLLGKMSLLAAESGADVIAPSDMMDGRIGYLRQLLDSNGFEHVSLLSYAAKYASAHYGPFRDALGSAPKIGDKKSYQLNPANTREAIREAELDIAEGADMLLVKPALPYLDIVSAIRKISPLPLGAYHVSGEYSMVMAAAEKGWLNAEKVFYEQLLCIRRAGADFILTYAAKRMAQSFRGS
jgi:porphobilinogen synthase